MYLSHTVRSSLARHICTKNFTSTRKVTAIIFCFNTIFLKIIHSSYGMTGWGGHKNPRFDIDSFNAYRNKKKSNLSSGHLSPVSNLGDIL